MFEQINNDLKDALKNGDKFKLSVLRMVKSALQLEAINNKKELTDELVVTVLKRQVKQRNDSKSEYEKLGQIAIAESLQKEIDIINCYLPKEATEEEINNVIDAAFIDIKPTSMKDMGLIMKYVSNKLANADMTKVSSIVKERLSK